MIAKGQTYYSTVNILWIKAFMQGYQWNINIGRLKSHIWNLNLRVCYNSGKKQILRDVTGKILAGFGWREEEKLWLIPLLKCLLTFFSRCPWSLPPPPTTPMPRVGLLQHRSRDKALLDSKSFYLVRIQGIKNCWVIIKAKLPALRRGN